MCNVQGSYIFPREQAPVDKLEYSNYVPVPVADPGILEPGARSRRGIIF